MQAGAERKSIRQKFDELRSRGTLGLAPFLPAGFPDLQTTVTCIAELEEAGASVIEIGIPFSDPIADGPIVQEAFTAALAKKIRVADVFGAVVSVRSRVSVPLAAMVSYSIVFRYGVERFSRDARAAGFDALILPDLPPPEAQRVCQTVRSADLDTILLVAPTTSRERRHEIAQLSSGFVYYLSISGITGERDQLPPDLSKSVRELRDLTDRPICVGFGIHKRQHLVQLKGIADGAIVGSAFVRRIQQQMDAGPEAIGQAVARYARELLGKVDDV